MSTTKHLILTERPGTHIEIVSVDGRPAIVVTDNYKSSMAYFERENGAKTALAILEAAGHGKESDSSRLMQAFDLIELHVNEQERAAAEAKEQSELEAEALDLYNVRMGSDATNHVEAWVARTEFPHDRLRIDWLAVARRAREMRAEK